MIEAAVAVIFGIIFLVISADHFVVGAASVSRRLGVPPLIIGMLIMGFGTSAPELIVSCIAAFEGNPGIALGNAYGSNISNIALILGVTACISPIFVESRILRRELPILMGVTGIAAIQLLDGWVSRVDAIILLVLFGGFMFWSIWQGMKGRADNLSVDVEAEFDVEKLSPLASWMKLILGLIFLVISSRILVWGAVTIAESLGVSNLIIGLTVVAIGTSLPELASSIVATRKGEHDLALGNVLGSNLFNTLAVVGLAGVIKPIHGGSEILVRDISVMSALTLVLFLVSLQQNGERKINRFEGGLLVLCYVSYLAYLVILIVK